MRILKEIGFSLSVSPRHRQANTRKLNSKHAMKINSLILLLSICAVTGGCRTAAPGMSPSDLKALAARADAARKNSGYTPGREYANLLNSEWLPEWLAFFNGRRTQPENGPPTVKEAVFKITRITSLAEYGEKWPMPGLIHVPRATGQITIDGCLDEPDWARAATFSGVYRFNETTLLSVPKTTWKIHWDDTNLNFSFDCDDSDLVAPAYRRDERVYTDDCVEVFLLPDIRFRTFWEIVVSPSGSVFDSVECKRAQLWGSDLDPTQNMADLKTGITVRGTLNTPDDTVQGYTVEISVPFKELPGYTRSGPKTGDRLRFMLVRLDRQGKLLTPYSFQPLLGWGHNIWNHAEMELSK